jgi:hypothetical protein
MNRLLILGMMLAATALFASPALAQKKPAKKPTKARTSATIPPLDVRAARGKVDIQLFNVNDFLNKLGPIAVSLETAIADQRAGKLRTETSQAVDGAREKLVASIRGLREALTPLESEFRTKASLQKYLPTVQGITDLGAEAEDAAIAGQFVASKEPLRKVVQKLTDTLAVMPR